MTVVLQKRKKHKLQYAYIYKQSYSANPMKFRFQGNSYKMRLLCFLLTLSSIICDNFTTLVLSQANCVLALQYYSPTSFNLLTCYQLKNTVESTSIWSNCTKRCCDPNKTYEQVRASIESCDRDRIDYQKTINQDQGSSSKDIKMKILEWILFGILVLLSLILIICFIKKACEERNSSVQYSMPQRVPQASVIPSRPILHIESEIFLSPFRPDARIEWTKQKKRDEACPICLAGNTNIELAACRHMVHWECWKEWSKRKRQCALCRSNDVSQLKIYCYSCKDAYFTCRNSAIQMLSTCPKIVCDKCKGRNLT